VRAGDELLHGAKTFRRKSEMRCPSVPWSSLGSL
jgi:hypothetical protein